MSFVYGPELCHSYTDKSETASPAAALVKLLRAHDLVECAACASTKATVAADRLHVSAVAVCCEGTAAQ